MQLRKVKDMSERGKREKRWLLNTCRIALANEVSVADPARLITLLEDCVKWQQHQGLLPLDSEFDLFRGSDQVQETENDAFADSNYTNIKVREASFYMGIC